MTQKQFGSLSKPNCVDAGAVLSRCKRYRYVVWRCWEVDLPGLLFIGLNPSTADATKDDPTLLRCVDFALKWGYGSVYVVNLFAYRATNPKNLLRANDPVGPRNNMWTRKLIKCSDRVVVAWGNNGSYRERSNEVLRLIPKAYCLKVNRSGEPSHPLYLPKTATLRHYRWADLSGNVH